MTPRELIDAVRARVGGALVQLGERLLKDVTVETSTPEELDAKFSGSMHDALFPGHKYEDDYPAQVAELEDVVRVRGVDASGPALTVAGEAMRRRALERPTEVPPPERVPLEGSLEDRIQKARARARG